MRNLKGVHKHLDFTHLGRMSLTSLDKPKLPHVAFTSFLARDLDTEMS